MYFTSTPPPNSKKIENEKKPCIGVHGFFQKSLKMAKKGVEVNIYLLPQLTIYFHQIDLLPQLLLIKYVIKNRINYFYFYIFYKHFPQF